MTFCAIPLWLHKHMQTNCNEELRMLCVQSCATCCTSVEPSQDYILMCKTYMVSSITKGSRGAIESLGDTNKERVTTKHQSEISWNLSWPHGEQKTKLDGLDAWNFKAFHFV